MIDYICDLYVYIFELEIWTHRRINHIKDGSLYFPSICFKKPLTFCFCPHVCSNHTVLSLPVKPRMQTSITVTVLQTSVEIQHVNNNASPSNIFFNLMQIKICKEKNDFFITNCSTDGTTLKTAFTILIQNP